MATASKDDWKTLNMLSKMYCVYFVFPPTDEDEDFVTITKSPLDHLGYSRLHGMFCRLKPARKFAFKLAGKIGCKIDLASMAIKSE